MLFISEVITYFIASARCKHFTEESKVVGWFDADVFINGTSHMHHNTYK